MTGRSIRKSVKVVQEKQGYTLVHPAWTLELASCVDPVNIFRDRDISRENKLSGDMHAVHEFLHSQHLYDFADIANAKTVSPEDLIAICRACSNEWFGLLYSHPWWETLAHYAKRETIKSWILQNYSLSKIAAMSSAIAVKSDSLHSAFFVQSIVEEYDHHERFFRKPSKKFDLTDVDFDKPASRGIEVLKCYLAELAIKDELALLIFYYFQECTAYLVDDFREYYSHLEAIYDVRNYFGGWLDHVGEDEQFDHGGQVEAVLREKLPVSGLRLKNALEKVWACICLLLADYDNFTAPRRSSEFSDLAINIVERSIFDGSIIALSNDSSRENTNIYGEILGILYRKQITSDLPDFEDPWLAILHKLAATGFALDKKAASSVLHSLRRGGIGQAVFNNHESDGIIRLIDSVVLRRPPNLFSGGEYGAYPRRKI